MPRTISNTSTVIIVILNPGERISFLYSAVPLLDILPRLQTPCEPLNRHSCFFPLASSPFTPAPRCVVSTWQCLTLRGRLIGLLEWNSHLLKQIAKWTLFWYVSGVNGRATDWPNYQMCLTYKTTIICPPDSASQIPQGGTFRFSPPELLYD